MVKEITTVGADFEEMLKDWKKGDVAVLREILVHEAKQYSDLFLIKRKNGCLEHFDSFFRRGERLVVLVGAGHLTGKQRLIELIKVKGHLIERAQSV